LYASQYFDCDYNKVLTLILFHGKLLNNIKTVTSVMPMGQRGDHFALLFCKIMQAVTESKGKGENIA